MDKAGIKEYEIYPGNYEGDYRNIINLLVTKTWFGLLCILSFTLLIYILGYYVSPVIFYISFSIPTLLGTFYVLYPNANIRNSIILNWLPTAALILLIYLIDSESRQSSINFGDYIGIIFWFYIFYWIFIGIQRNFSIIENLRIKKNYSAIWDLLSRLMVVWGITLQIAFFFGMLVLPFLKDIATDSVVYNSFTDFIRTVTGLSITRFLPLSLIVLGLLLMAWLKFSNNPYNPIAFESIFKGNYSPLINLFLQIIRLPIWLSIIIIGFVSHFTKLMFLAIGEIGYSYFARLTYIIISIILAPVVLCIGHAFTLASFIILAEYLNMDFSFSLSTSLSFIYVNILFVFGLCAYVVAMPLLSLSYRGENIKNLIASISLNLSTNGKKISLATGRTYSLFGLVAFVVPIAILMPGGLELGTFSIIYGAIIVISLAFYLYKTERSNFLSLIGKDIPDKK